MSRQKACALSTKKKGGRLCCENYRGIALLRDSLQGDDSIDFFKADGMFREGIMWILVWFQAWYTQAKSDILSQANIREVL